MQSFHIDTDNGLGSPKGDVDDGFAIAALLRSDHEVLGISSVAGNTPSELSYQNCQLLASQCGYEGPVVLGSEGSANPAAELMRGYEDPYTLMALGPLTNIAQCLNAPIERIILVGGNYTSWGRWPPVFPFEYNLTKDRAATTAVLQSDIPITIVPLDVAGRFRFTFRDLQEMPGPLGDFIRQRAQRWYRRALWLKWHTTVPIWDLLAAMAVLAPQHVRIESSFLRCHPNAWLEFSKTERAGFRPVGVVAGFDKASLWRAFCALLEGDLGSVCTEGVAVTGECAEP